MDTKDLKVIKNNQKLEEPKSRQTNPITNKFVKFHNQKLKFSVKDLFNVPN